MWSDGPIHGWLPPVASAWLHETLSHAGAGGLSRFGRKHARLRDGSILQSPLTDSNRRPPPYHGGFVHGRHGAALAVHIAVALLIARFEVPEGCTSSGPQSTRLVRNLSPRLVPTRAHSLGSGSRRAGCPG